MFNYGLDQEMSATQGEEEPRLALLDYFPAEQMQPLQDHFAQTHQLAVLMTDLEGNWITRPSNFSILCQILQGAEKVKERCELTYKVIGENVRASGVLTWQECLNCGFVEAGIPIWVGGQHVANCLVGQNNALNVSPQRVEEYAWLMEVDILQVRHAFAAMPSLPIDQLSNVLNLLGLYASEVLEQAFKAHQLATEVNRLRQMETSLRHEGIEVIQTLAILRESIQRIGRDLQEVLRTANEITDEHDHLRLPGTVDESELVLTDWVQKIRRSYRTVLDAMALEQNQREEMEKLLYGSRPGLHRRRFARRRVASALEAASINDAPDETLEPIEKQAGGSLL